MIVVADTTPLNYLILLGHSEILPNIYGSVIVPPAVLVEMMHPDAPPKVRAWAVAPPAWLQRISVVRVDESLTLDLGLGEREAISLAIELRADVLLIDDFAGRQQAEARNLVITGTLTILLQASLRGLLDFPLELGRLQRLGFRLSPKLEKNMLERYASGRAEL